VIPKASECIFCRTGEITEEHIFSRKWLKRLWNLPRGEQLGHQHARSDSEVGDKFDIRWSKQEADLVVYCICDRCNSEWMNVLDQRAQRIIDPMTQGQRTRLRTARDQLLLARWSLKIAFMFDYRQERPSIPQHFAQAFKERNAFPDYAYVWLAHNVPIVRGQANGVFHTLERNGNPDVYLVTFRVDQLVVQVVVGIAHEVRADRTGHRDALRQVWPLTYETVTWPGRTMDEFEYVMFANRFTTRPRT
jgi:hypothetical protein